MHHYKQSKKQVAIRFFSYGVLTVAVLVLSGIGILTVLGYQFDFTSRSLEQTALIQIASEPSGATVMVDTKELPGTTETRTNVTSGSHTANVSRDGYRSWQKTFNVTGGMVLWLNYALLVPSKLAFSTQGEIGTVSSDQTSPDKKWRLVSLTDRPTALTLVNLNDPKRPKMSTSTVSSDILTKSDDATTGSLAVVSWDSGSRYALVRHSYVSGGQPATEYLRFDRQNIGTVHNITKELGVTNISKIGFSDASGNTYYALAGTDIRKLDLNDGTISQPLISDVSQMYYTDGSETIAYARTVDGISSVGVYRDAGGVVTTNTYATPPANLLISYNEYYGYRYLATYHDNKVYVVQGPDTRQPKVVRTIDVPGASWLYFNPSGRMLVAQSGNSFMAYDLETNRVFNETLGSNDASTTKFTWLDDFHLVSDAGGSIDMSDFDGGNKFNLGTANFGTGVELSNNGQWLFTIKTVNDKTVLQRTALRVQ